MSTPCIFRSDIDGVTFDLTNLVQKDTFGRTIPFLANTSGYFSSIFGFSFCSTLDFYCDAPVSTSSFLKDSGTGYCFKNFGSYMQTTWRSKGSDPTLGIELTYSGKGLALGTCGDLYSSTSTVFDISCSPQLGALLVVDSLSVSEDGCKATYSIRSPAGCGLVSTRIIYPLGIGWIVFISIICIISVYIVFGILYKRYRYGARGIESIPNIQFWRTIFSCCGRNHYSKASVADIDGEYADIDDPTIT